MIRSTYEVENKEARIITSIWYRAEALDALNSMSENSVDAIVTDPPYGIRFMGSKWDYDVPDTATWAACLRVLKPGGHLLAFAGTRTQHRMAVRIEDAGFEIRDMIAWVYGSGFPKSLDVSKAILRRGSKGEESANKHRTALEYDGWGTALKPAMEPITMARKPLSGTVADTVCQFGTGGLNIDASRVELNGGYQSKANGRSSQTGLSDYDDAANANQPDTAGRWPANLIHDGSDEVRAAFPVSLGQQGDLKETGRHRPSSGRYGDAPPPHAHVARIDTDDSAARFFYCAKAKKRDRGVDNTHPTVKPIELMRHLCRLVTPPGGIILDPFMGSGSTGCAAVLDGYHFIGIDRIEDYYDIAVRRIRNAMNSLRVAFCPMQ